MPILTSQAFADAIGVPRNDVYKEIRRGKLVQCLRPSPTGKRKLIDLEIGRAEFFGHEIPLEPEPPKEDKQKKVIQSGPTSYCGESLEDSQAEEKFWKAKKAELDYRRHAGDLIDASLVSTAYHNEVASCRTKLLAVPSRIRQRIQMTDEQFSLVEDLVREALEELGRTDGTALPTVEDE